MLIEPVIRIAEPQYNAITRRQALRVMTRRQLDRLVANRTLVWVHPQTYVIGGSISTWHQRCMAAVLSIEGAAVSHRTSARLWGLNGVASQKIVVTAPTTKPLKRKGVTVRRSKQLAGFVTVHEGIATTVVARTIVDLSSEVEYSRLTKTLDEAMRLKLLTLAELDYCMNKMFLGGRARIGWLIRLRSQRNQTDESLDTKLEAKALWMIRDAGLPDPLSQKAVIANGTRYIPDLLYLKQKIIIEPDGPHHMLASVAMYDRIRDANFQLDGWMVIRITPEMDPEDFIPTLAEALVRRENRS